MVYLAVRVPDGRHMQVIPEAGAVMPVIDEAHLQADKVLSVLILHFAVLGRFFELCIKAYRLAPSNYQQSLPCHTTTVQILHEASYSLD